MTIAEVFQEAQNLNAQERKELIKLLLDSLEVAEPPRNAPKLKTGAEIAAMLDEMEPIEFVDPEIADPVEWVKAQRRKEANRLKPYWEGDK
jgi:hypothetical protein